MPFRARTRLGDPRRCGTDEDRDAPPRRRTPPGGRLPARRGDFPTSPSRAARAASSQSSRSYARASPPPLPRHQRPRAVAPQQRQPRARRRLPGRPADVDHLRAPPLRSRRSCAVPGRTWPTCRTSIGHSRPETTMIYARPELAREALRGVRTAGAQRRDRRTAAGWRTGSRWHGRLAEQCRCPVNCCKN